MKLNKNSILIAGGGIAGLTLANSLKIAKIPFLVLEKSHQFLEVSGGMGLWGPALKAMNALNLEENLKENGKLMKSAGYRKSDQIDKGQWLVEPSKNLNRHTSCLTISRSHLQKSLLKNINSDEIKFNSDVVDFVEKNDSIDVNLKNGEIITGSILIGADGINSNIRKKLFPNVNKKKCRYYYWQGICKIQDLSQIEIGYNRHTDDFPSYEAWHPGIRFGIVPLKAPEVFWFVAYDDNLNKYIDYNDKEMCKEYIKILCRPFGENVRKIIDFTEPSSIKNYDLSEFKIGNKWAGNRVCLLGDAAHAMAPNLAQGAVLSIEDALEMAHQLYLTYDHIQCKFHNTKSIESAFRKFEKKRIKRTRVVQRLESLVHEVGSAKNYFFKLRNFIFKIFPKIIKTTIFDITHRYALGWDYTAPNLGQGLYVRLLGSNFIENSEVLKKFHSSDIDRYCKGTITVRRGNKLNNLITDIFQLPKSIKNGIVELFVTSDKKGFERWNRKFYDENGNLISEFNTLQSLFNEQLFEEHKIFYFVFDKIINKESHSFDFILKDFGLSIHGFKVKFPKLLRPTLKAYTKETESGWNFKVELGHPKLLYNLLGDILIYEGTIDKILIK